MTIEGNFDYHDATQTEVTLKIPRYMADMWMLLLKKVIDKHVPQIHVKLSMPRKPRSTGPGSASNHFNGHCAQIANWTGDSFDDVKMHIKREAIAEGYPFRTDSFGNVIPQSEAEASTVEESILIETSHRVASFLSVILKEE